MRWKALYFNSARFILDGPYRRRPADRFGGNQLPNSPLFRDSYLSQRFTILSSGPGFRDRTRVQRYQLKCGFGSGCYYHWLRLSSFSMDSGSPSIANPIVLLKNALRIVATTVLGAFVDRWFIDGPFHRQYGGILFGLVGVALFLPILAGLRWTETRFCRSDQDRKTRPGSPTLSVAGTIVSRPTMSA